jgi:hypothetical protein
MSAPASPVSKDILILSNGPGEVSTWVKPVVQALRAQTQTAQIQAVPRVRISVMLSPCPHASGGEAASLRAYPEVDRVQEPQHFFKFLLTGKTAQGWDWAPQGVVVFLGGDQFYAVLAAKRLGYQSVIYAEWEARWLKWVDRVAVMQAGALEKVKPDYRHKVKVIGDLMADVQTRAAEPAALEQRLPVEPGAELIGLLPGSKVGKLGPGVPLTLAIANHIHTQRPKTQFVIFVAPTVSLDYLHRFTDPTQNPTVPLVNGPKVDLYQPSDANSAPYYKTESGAQVFLWQPFPAHDLLKTCQLCLTTVGANTAQLGALAVPMMVLLPTQQLDAMRTWEGIFGVLGSLPGVGLAVNRLINRVMFPLIQKSGKKFAWPNIWAKQEVVPELFGRLSADTIGNQVIDYLDHPEKLQAMQQTLQALRGPSGAADKMATIILETLPPA